MTSRLRRPMAVALGIVAALALCFGPPAAAYAATLAAPSEGTYLTYRYGGQTLYVGAIGTSEQGHVYCIEAGKASELSYSQEIALADTDQARRVAWLAEEYRESRDARIHAGIGVLAHRLTLILMHVGFSVSMATFMFQGAIFTSVPAEIEEAAEIDGCSKWKTFWSIVFPLLKPMIATVAVIDAMGFWNDYLLPSLVLTDKNLYTIPIATQVFYGTYSTDIGLVMAALLLAMLPILILYLFLQRYIIAGVAAGAVKG